MADEPAERPPLAARIEQGFGTEATSSPSQPCPNAATVGEPGFWEGAIPIWGSGKAAIWRDFCVHPPEIFPLSTVRKAAHRYNVRFLNPSAIG